MNDHPLQQDLSQLSDDELDKRYNELSRRYQLARRMGMDQYVLHQMDIMLTGIETEKYRRMDPPEDTNATVLETDPLSKQKDK